MKIKIDRNKFIGDNQPCFIIAEIGNNHEGSYKVAKKLVSKAIECGADAIKIQSIADVPLGSFLSGGIDSSLITALLQESSNKNIRSFTISFPDEPKFNEAPYANAIAKRWSR